MRLTTLFVFVLAVACAGGHRDPSGAGNQNSPPPSAPDSPDAGDGQASVPPPTVDGGVAWTPPVDLGAPAAEDLVPLTSAPPVPAVDTTCDASSIQRAPAGHHPGACRVLGKATTFYNWEMIYTVDRKYADGRVATERREEWGASTASALADYKRTVTDNTWDGQGRAQRSLQRIWHFEGPSAGNAVTWSSTVFGYGDRKYSASTWSAGNSSGQPAITAPVLTHEQEFVIDSRGTVINTR